MYMYERKIILLITNINAGRSHSVFSILHCLKKRHWCCTLWLRRTSTDFGKFWQRCCWDSMLSNCDLLSHFSWLISVHYLGKHEPRKLCLFSYAVSRKRHYFGFGSVFLRHSLSVSAVHFHPRLDEEQLSAAEFCDSNGHHQRRGERWPTTQQAFSSDVALLCIARRVDAIVLQVDWWRYNEHFFVRGEDEVDSMFRK